MHAGIGAGQPGRASFVGLVASPRVIRVVMGSWGRRVDAALPVIYLSAKITGGRAAATLLYKYFTTEGIMTTKREVQTRAGATTWHIDPAHTQVGFAVRHMMFATVRGQFSTVRGELRIDDENPERSEVEVHIEAASIDTRNEQRDAHLRSADFFDVENHPELVFVARGFERVGERQYRVAGDLTIRGTTREVVLDAEETGRGRDPWGQQKLGFTATATINRRDFGLTWNQALETGGVLVSDEVQIIIDGQASDAAPDV